MVEKLQSLHHIQKHQDQSAGPTNRLTTSFAAAKKNGPPFKGRSKTARQEDVKVYYGTGDKRELCKPENAGLN